MVVVVMVMFVVVMGGKCDATADEADGANGAEDAPVGEAATAARAATCYRCGTKCAIGRGGGDVVGEDVFGGDDDRIAVEAAVALHTDQRAFAAGKVVLDDKIGTAAVVEGDEQVIAGAGGVNADRAGAGRGVGELVVRAVDGVNLLNAGGVEIVMGDGVAIDVFDVECDLCHLSLSACLRFSGNVAPQRLRS